MAEKKDFPVFRVGIVTLSDKGYQGEREDKSGPRIKELLPAEQYEVVSMRLLPDERAMIEEELIRLSDLAETTELPLPICWLCWNRMICSFRPSRH